MPKLYKSGLSIRGDSYYCPLSFQLDTYWGCENECLHCYMRRLNRTWGKKIRILDVEGFKKKLMNGLKNENPKSSLSFAIKNKKTIRLGNKADPYQMIDKEYKVTRKAIKILLDLDWSFVIQTKFTENVNRDINLMKDNSYNITIMIVLTPGFLKDWEVFEKKGTTNPDDRLQDLIYFKKLGFNTGINGEPFIPGYHTIKDFEQIIRIIKSYGFKSYNTYHLHYNDWVAKNFLKIGLDIEKIWHYNQDGEWKKILIKLIEITKKYDIDLGCPDFVNSGNYTERANTCCGIDVPNPCTFNMISWKKLYLQKNKIKDIIELTWDGIGNKKMGKELLEGKENNYYSLKDIK